MKKVLIVAYAFPPVGGAGVQRPVKFVKYLRRFGWEPVVLTAENPSVPIQDPALLKDVPEGVKIYRARTLEPSYAAKKSFSSSAPAGPGAKVKALAKSVLSLLLLPDVQVLWWPGLVARMVEAIRKEKPECLYVTAPPFSSFLPVVALGRVMGVPVVLDYRDEWTFSRNSWENASKSRLAFFADSFLEKLALANCQAFTAATQSYVDTIARRFGAAAAGKGHVITNGYDSDDFELKEAPSQERDPQTINIVYSGTVWKATSLDFFCAALEKAVAANPGIRGRVRVKVYGRIVGDEASALDREPLKGMIECSGYIEHEKVVEEVMDADFLLLTLSDLPGAEKIIHGKAFEYMASGRHILAVVPEGEVKRLITEEYGNATTIHPHDADSAAKLLNELFDNVQHFREARGGDVTKFHRERLTSTLASIFDWSTQCRPRPS